MAVNVLRTVSNHLMMIHFFLYWTIMQVTFTTRSVVSARIIEYLWSPFHLTPLIV